MKILAVLTYYRPHVSGLTIYVERLGKALVALGHEVTVLTSQYDSDLPQEETIEGVHVIRVPVAFRVSKGVIMPTFGFHATRLARTHDIIHLHLPQFDAPGLALRGKILKKPVVLTYHCDLHLPKGIINRLVNSVVLTMNQLAGSMADAVVTYTRDYGTHSPFLRQYLGRKLQIIPPPVELAPCPDTIASEFQQKHQLAGHQIIGISARLATEKGVEILLKALPNILEKYPNAFVLHAGPFQNIIGEEEYAARLQPLLEKHKAVYHFLGTLHGAELTAFYKSLDCLVIPSLNSTESFGLVQIEAMTHGVPVVASNLPGVRQPVTMSGMGEVVPIGDHLALASAVNRILTNKASYQRPAQLIADSFAPSQTATAYIDLFQQLLTNNLSTAASEPVAYENLRQMNETFND